MARFAEAMMPALVNAGEDGALPIELSDDDEGDHFEQNGGLPIKFSEDDLVNQLLRGVPSYEIVAGAGVHWEANSQGQKTVSWALSVPVKRNTMFISHSWKASRFLKWLSLLAFLNGKMTAFAGIVAALSTLLVEMRCGVLTPFPDYAYFGRNMVVVQSMTPFIAGMTVATVFFFSGHHLRRPLESFCLKPQFAFLDKLVIHQDDPALKERGIHLLGAFIGASDTFLVLWSEEYLTRLWCSYELAVYAYLQRVLNGRVRIEVWPLPFAMIVLAKIMKTATVVFTTMTSIAAHTHPIIAWCSVLVTTMLVLLAVVAMSELGKAHEAMQRQIATYDLRATDCFAESDREIVEAAVTRLFDPDTGNRDEAILRFNRFVQQDLLVAIGESFNKSGRLNMRAVLWILLPYIFFDTFGCAADTQMVPVDYWQMTLGNVFCDTIVGMLVFAWQFEAVSCINDVFDSCGSYAFLSGGNSRSSSWWRCRLCLNTLVCSLLEYLFILSSICTFLLPPVYLALVYVGIVALVAHKYR